MQKQIFFLIFLSILIHSCKEINSDMLIKSTHYTIYRDSVVQGQFSAIALSSNQMKSNYYSLEADNFSSQITFKFSINSRDNEMISGTDHCVRLNIAKGNHFITEVKFGEQLLDTTGIQIGNLPKNTQWTVKLDLRSVFQSFDSQGFFTLFDGSKLYKEDFKNVYIAGATPPLSWDFENLHQKKELRLTDSDNDHIYEVQLLLNPERKKGLQSVWKLESNLSHLPKFESDITLSNALYTLSLDELMKNMAEDSTYNTGKEWAGVWTRDVSYSTVLALALIQPEIAQNSLLRKVKNKRIIQDTGSGGAWPVSTDRTTWALAAWEIYKFTGDKNWLAQAFEIIKNTLNDDLKVTHDPKTHLVNGESSFLDWREQSYPKWMQPADIFNSKCLGTNVVHYQAFIIAAQMAKLLGKEDSKYLAVAQNIKKAINTNLWQEEKGYYGQFLYGKNYTILSPRSEALGEALSVLYNVADSNKQTRIIQNTPIGEFGIPCIFPEIPNIQAYHNNAIWPFVETFWALAAAKVGNEEALTHSIGSIYRQAALFLTNKENMVAESGDFAGTAINSDRQLWSVAGNLALVYRIFIGMNFKVDGIEFKPFIPINFSGEKHLSNFKYRNMILDINISGFGSEIAMLYIDGHKSHSNFLSADLKGSHSIEIILSESNPEKQGINLQTISFSPETANKNNYKNNEKFEIFKNGLRISENVFQKQEANENNFLEEFMFTHISPKGFTSFSAKPFSIIPKETYLVEIENFATKSSLNYKGFSGKGFVELSLEKNTEINFEVDVKESGIYSIDFKYANGTGPVNTDNNCAIRTLWLEDNFVGSIVLPQRGKEEWSNWGFSNSREISLHKGKNKLKLTYEDYDRNMDGTINTAMIDFARILRLK